MSMTSSDRSSTRGGRRFRGRTRWNTFRGRAVAAAALACAVSVTAAMVGPYAMADPADPPDPPNAPSDAELIRPLPAVTPTPTNWTPKFPFPYDQTRASVTDADINAERELCQWYTAQYGTLRDQIDRLQFNRIAPDGTDFDYGVDDVQQQVDVVTNNIAQSLTFMEPRVRAFTQDRNPFGDGYFPLYEAEAFFKLWEQLSNVHSGILAHQPDWFTGPSVQKAKRWGSDIQRSHVCD